MNDKKTPQQNLLSTLGLVQSDSSVQKGVYLKSFQLSMESLASQNGFTFVPVSTGQQNFKSSVSSPGQKSTGQGAIVLPSEKTYTRVATDAYVTYVFRLSNSEENKIFLKSTLDVFKKESKMEEVKLPLEDEESKVDDSREKTNESPVQEESVQNQGSDQVSGDSSQGSGQ